MVERITDRFVKAVTPPSKGDHLYRDTELAGFALRVTAGGVKTFVFCFRLDGGEYRMAFARFPTWTVAAARERAKELRRQVDRGENPLSQRIEARLAATIKDLWLDYDAKHLPTKRARSAADDRSMWRTYILKEWGSRKVADITPADVDELHAKISATKPIRANRVVEVVSKAMNLAIRWKWRRDNPCVGVHQNPEQGRQRYLTDDEALHLDQVLREHPERSSCDAIRLLLLTGARKTEALNATWAMFDLDKGDWVKPSSHTKQKREHRVPLSPEAVELLREIKSQGRDEVYVFPGRGMVRRSGRSEPERRPLTDIKHTWSAVCRLAGIEDARIHDLRHTFASIVISDKNPLSVVGALLGHTQAQTTQKYAHLHDAPQRRAVEAVGRRFSSRRSDDGTPTSG
jgi:integrase